MPKTPDVPASVEHETVERLRRVVAAHPDLKFVTERVPGGRSMAWPVDSVIRLQKDVDGPEPDDHTYHVHKNRFPRSFPDKPAYDVGFGSGVTREWLLKNDPAYSRPTFGELTCNSNGMGWFGGAGRLVEMHGHPVPGTVVIERGVHRADLDGRVGLIIGTSMGVLQVVWSPWRFREGT